MTYGKNDGQYLGGKLILEFPSPPCIFPNTFWPLISGGPLSYAGGKITTQNTALQNQFSQNLPWYFFLDSSRLLIFGKAQVSE
jgi:hypothetical protein